MWDQDTNAIDAIRQVKPNRIYLLPYNPTAENMAIYLLSKIAPQLIETIKGYDLRVTKVVVWETENAFAEVTVDASRNQADALLHRVQQGAFHPN